MKAITKKDLGKKLGTTYVAGLFSFSIYEKGYIIKPVKQRPIIINKEIAFHLYNHMTIIFDEEQIEKEI